MKTTILRSLFIQAALLLLCVPAEAALREERHALDLRSYSMDETGTISQLGIQVAVKPLMANGSVSGFQVGLSYKDPSYSNSPEVSFLNPNFFSTPCFGAQKQRQLGKYRYTNERRTRFIVRLLQGCKNTPDGLQVPFLEIEVRCSDAAHELRYLRFREEGRFFDIHPTGNWGDIQTNAGKVLEAGEQIYELYDTVSTVLVILDLLVGSHGTLAAGQFVIKMIKGKATDLAVDLMFQYGQSKYGTRPEFKHTGWTVFCRLCRSRFHRKSLADGERLKCTNTRCRAEVNLRFH